MIPLLSAGHYLKQITSTFQGFFVLLTSTVIAMTSIQQGILVLTIAVVLDFISGCVASWTEHKQDNTTIKVYFFESGKMRLSVLKMVSYCMLIFFAWAMTILFFDKGMGLPGSTKQFKVTELVTGVCISIELWSNVENLKRSGFDIFDKIKTGSAAMWNLVKAVKNPNQDV